MDPSLIKIKTGAKAFMGQNQEEMEEGDEEENPEIEIDKGNVLEKKTVPEILTLNDKMFQILRYHKLILSQTASVELLPFNFCLLDFEYTAPVPKLITPPV